MRTALDKAHVAPDTADAIVNDYTKARFDGLRASTSVLAVIALIAVVFSRRLPTRQPGSTAPSEP